MADRTLVQVLVGTLKQIRYIKDRLLPSAEGGYRDSLLGVLAEAEVRLANLQKWLPSGSGFDLGTRVIDVGPLGLLLRTWWHRLNEDGYYDGYCTFKVLASPDWEGLRIQFLDVEVEECRDAFSEYWHQVFHDCLTASWNLEKECPNSVLDARKVEEGNQHDQG